MKNGKYEEDGSICWYLNGLWHREDGPARILANGDKSWYINGEFHREDGPAIEFIGDKHWFINGKRHREDGPAIERHNGDNEWFLHDESVTEEEISHLIEKKNLNEKLNLCLTDKNVIKRSKI